MGHFSNCNPKYSLDKSPLTTESTLFRRIDATKTRTNRNSPEAMFHNIERTEHGSSNGNAHFTLSVSLSISLRWAWIFNAQQFLVLSLFEHINWELTSFRLDTPFWYHFKTQVSSWAMKILKWIQLKHLDWLNILNLWHLKLWVKKVSLIELCFD